MTHNALYRCVAALVTSVCVVSCDRASDVARTNERTVVIFTAHDRIYSEPILRAFEAQTSIKVKPVYDAESAKTTGLINRLLARRDDPECDVLWNNEVVQTVALAEQGLLAEYESPAASRFPPEFRDAKHRWAGFAGRLRVLIYNKQHFPEKPPPASLSIFTDNTYRNQGVIALPFYGTTFTHIAVLRDQWGEDRLRNWLRQIRANGTEIASGNGAVCDLVAAGERSFGLTDTDDANGALLEGKPIGILIPDPAEGAVLIPNSVALIRGARHPEEAKKLIDYLLSKDVETALAASASAQIPLGTDLSEASHPLRDLLRDAPPRSLPLKTLASHRRELIELLREVRLDQ